MYLYFFQKSVIHAHQTTLHLSIPMNDESYDFDDDKEAVKFQRLYAEKGVVNAQFRLAQMYYEGLEVAQDYKEALKWYRLAAGQGDAKAQNNLGVMYNEGQGVPQDNKEAVKWWRLSAEQRNERAQVNLALMHDDSLDFFNSSN